MKITVIGTGYGGLVTGTCLAEVGYDVLCLDLDAAKIETLKSGTIPIHEPGLQDLVRSNAAAGRLRFSTDVQEAVNFGQIQFIAVGTPPDEDGSADMQLLARHQGHAPKEWLLTYVNQLLAQMGWRGSGLLRRAN